jgi:hypothetical protein
MENKMPGVVDVQVKVLKLGKHICTSVLYIGGVPRTDEKQIHLARFPNDHPLVHLLKKADTVCVTKRNPPDEERLELKKCGVHLIFEGDDDYEGDEESLDKGLQSVSERLARFFNTCDEGVDATESEDDQCQHELEQEKEETTLLPLKGLGVFFVLLGLFWFRCMSSSPVKRD